VQLTAPVLVAVAFIAIVADVLSLSASPVWKIILATFLVGTVLLVAKAADRVSAVSRRPPWRWLIPCLPALLVAGGIVGYLQGPALVSAIQPLSRDADILGYCIEVMHVDSFEPLVDPTLPRSPQGQFFCKGAKQPVNMEQACRWKWGPQAKPPTLANENSSYSWRCHPKYR
jgi:hypothetical protein